MRNKYLLNNYLNTLNNYCILKYMLSQILIEKRILYSKSFLTIIKYFENNIKNYNLHTILYKSFILNIWNPMDLKHLYNCID